MFQYDESPFKPEEVRQILRLTKSEFAQAQLKYILSKNVICHFRCDDSFNYSNYYDILDFRLQQIQYERNIDEQDVRDIVSDFVDRMASGLEPGKRAYPEDIGATLYRVTQALKYDTFGRELREFSRFGEHLLRSDVLTIRTDQREHYLCSVAVAILHRTLPIFYALPMKRETSANVVLVDQTVAVCQGKLCSHYPEALLGGRDEGM